MRPQQKVTPLTKLDSFKTSMAEEAENTYTKGILAKLHGFKVGRGCLMIPLENASKLISLLEKEGVIYFIRHVWCN